MNAVETKIISFKYKGREACILKNACFELEQGKIAAITGPSGSGKSTFGYCVCGLIPNTIPGDFIGQVKIQGRAGIVFQDPDSQIFFTTVEDELAFGPENLCLSRQVIGNRIEYILDLLGLTALRLVNPNQLSGGQKQLVALGGVLTLSPDIIVLDEVMSQLDVKSMALVSNALLALKSEGKSIIMIEHDKKNLTIADEVWLLEPGNLGRVSIVGDSANG